MAARTPQAPVAATKKATSKTVEQQLATAQHDLAELIDEINYAEGKEREAKEDLAKAAADRDVLLECVDNLTTYASKLEHEVVLPALGDINTALADHKRTGVQRVNTVASLGRAQNATGRSSDRRQVSTRMRNIFDLMRAPTMTAAEAMERRDTVLRDSQRQAVVDMEDALVLSAGLLSSKQHLSAMIADTTRRLAVLNPDSAAAASSTVDAINSAEKLKNDNAELTLLLTQAQSERDTLLTKVQSQEPYEALQKQWHSERSALQAKIQLLEGTVAGHSTDRVAVAEQFETVNEALSTAQQEKALLLGEVRLLKGEKASRQSEAMAARAGGGTTTQHELRLELESVTRLHSATVTQLQAEIATLRVEGQRSQRSQAHEAAHSAQLENLQKNNEVLRRDIAVLQQQMLSSGPERDRDPLALETKVRSFELTIQQLNGELAVVDRKIEEVERHFSDEKRQLIVSFDAERQRAQQEREECDALVLKMTNELEFLMRENTALKQRAAAPTYSAVEASSSAAKPPAPIRQITLEQYQNQSSPAQAPPPPGMSPISYER
jgi:chromosome segregation ATPase